MTYLNIIATAGWLFAAIAQAQYAATQHNAAEWFLVLLCMTACVFCVFAKDRQFRL